MLPRAALLAAGLIAYSAAELHRPWLANAGLNQWPMLQAHDAGTGYLEPSTLIQDIVYKFTKTQFGNVSSQLGCGVRAFDWRPSLQGSVLGFAHGPVFVNHSSECRSNRVVCCNVMDARLLSRCRLAGSAIRGRGSRNVGECTRR